MKKLGLLVMAFALVMTMSQCKKEENVKPNDSNDGVTITLNVKSSGDSKVNINPYSGTVTFQTGDVIYVVSGGKFVGTLTHNGTIFSGDITDPTEGQPLYFYFFGNKTPTETLVAGTSESCSVVISDQSESLPVISCGPSEENFNGSGQYSAFLYNKCALVKFNVVSASSTSTYLTGLNNKVSIDFSNNGITYGKEGNGFIKLDNVIGFAKWAILLPQEAIEAGSEGSAYSQDGRYSGVRPAIPAISENDHLTEGIDVFVMTDVNPGTTPYGAISGKFTINSYGSRVYFSRGNLQYKALSGQWRFAENQWDYVGSGNSWISGTNNNWIDLFGWGTSGWNNGNVHYHPSSYESTGGVAQGYGYGPTNGSNYQYDLTGTYSRADWGVYNNISNGGNGWHTLTMSEWSYVLNNRHTAYNIRWVSGTVLGKNGIILLPDNWNTSYYALDAYNNNIISSNDWVNIFEAHGAVFLPKAGYRFYTSVYEAGTSGNYWSSNCCSSSSAYYMRCYGTSVNATMNNTRQYGKSVRLVRSAN